MTCTHAAITRRRLIELGFKYDSVVMEEAAQVLEIESLIPMLLQNTDAIEGCRLKRVVMIGDHHQLPPVVQHMAIKKFSKLDQSLFTRFVRLGVPSILLDKQGRARPEIAGLYSWRYSKPTLMLGNLDNIYGEAAFRSANPGIVYPFQLIDVPAFNGKGEFSPTPFFFFFLGEDEHVVAMFQYMRLLGYPAEKISIITTYNGQKHLIRDIISQRCKNPIFGQPATVTTVDKFQGQQNDYILLSLVKTESVGHLRDIRRLVVALSRARLGLYVFCRQSLFENCFELSTAFNLLLSRPTVLRLVGGETYDTESPCGRSFDQYLDGNSAVMEITNVTAMGVLVYQMAQQRLSRAAAPVVTILHEEHDDENEEALNKRIRLEDAEESPVEMESTDD